MFKFARFLSLSILLALPSCGKPVRTDSPAVLYPDRIVTLPEKQDEAATKLDRLLSLLKRESLSGVVILAPANFAWITAGADTDGIGEAAASFLFVREDGRKFFICA